MLLLLLACAPAAEKDAPIGDDTAACAGPDADGDGFPVCDDPALSDCDDADPANWPGNSERCNDHDDDCDGLVDADDPDAQGVVDQYTDADGDHWGTTFLVHDCPPLSEAGVAFSTGDCDDADPTVNPEAAERCDGVDDDCDPATSEDGVATFVGDAGAEDWTDRFGAGEVALDAAGTLRLCAGSWSGRLVVSADVTVEGAGADTAELSAGGEGSVVTTTANLTISGITLRDGAAADGGALACAGEATVTTEDVWFADSTATRGGAIATDGCTVYAWGGAVTGTSAERGGAVWVGSGHVELNDMDVDGTATVEGGALLAEPAAGEEAFVSLGDTLVSGSSAPVAGAVLLRGDVAMHCYGTNRDRAGLLGNTSDAGGALVVEDGAGAEFIGCDLGEPDTADDNRPIDVTTPAGDYTFGDDLLGWCWDDGCELLEE